MPLKIMMTTTRTDGPPLGDELTFAVPCPKCGHETEQAVSRLKDDPTLVCPSCSEAFKFESGGSMREVADQVDNIDRLFESLGKS